MFLEIIGGYDNPQILIDNILNRLNDAVVSNVRFYNDDGSEHSAYINAVLSISDAIRRMHSGIPTQITIGDDLISVDEVKEIVDKNIQILAYIRSSNDKLNISSITSINRTIGYNIFDGACVEYDYTERQFLHEVVLFFNELCESPIFSFSEINSFDKSMNVYNIYDEEIKNTIANNTYLQIETNKYGNFKLIQKIKINDCYFVINGERSDSMFLVVNSIDKPSFIMGINQTKLFDTVTYSIIKLSDDKKISEYFLNDFNKVFFTTKGNDSVIYLTYRELERRT